MCMQVADLNLAHTMFAMFQAHLSEMLDNTTRQDPGQGRLCTNESSCVQLQVFAPSQQQYVETNCNRKLLLCMQVSHEVVQQAGNVDLIILEGMGRGIETNLHAQFSVDSLKLGMIKHREVRWLHMYCLTGLVACPDLA